MDDQSKFIDAEDMVTCPYNSAHLVTRKRLAIHIAKCKKQHAELSKGTKICPHNIQHVIPREEFQYHLQICADRDNDFLKKFTIGQEQNDTLPELMKNMAIPAEINIPNEENWDEESTTANILADIKVGSQNKIALNSFSNLPPAERKQLRMENRRKTREKLNRDEQEFEKKKTEFTKNSSKRNDDDKQSSSKRDDDKTSVVSAASVKSCASSLGSDISYKTALTSSAMRLQSFQKVEEKKVLGRGRGRSGRVLSAEPNVKLGIGRSKLYK